MYKGQIFVFLLFLIGIFENVEAGHGPYFNSKDGKFTGQRDVKVNASREDTIEALHSAKLVGDGGLVPAFDADVEYLPDGPR